jgi:hypothetical protein
MYSVQADNSLNCFSQNGLTINKPLARWTIGPVQPDGFDCLVASIESFTRIYDVEPVICYNCEPQYLPTIAAKFRLIDQRQHLSSLHLPPKGVAWKLYPPRLAPDRHEIFIDNDLILAARVSQIDEFLASDCTLLLEETSRTYGRFEKHVPPGKCINSGIFGIPPGFDLKRYVDFYAGNEWKKNANNEHARNETWDEQGLIAFALLNYPRSVIIPRTVITNCEYHLVDGKGFHFIGLNRRQYHRPFRTWKHKTTKIHL